MCRANDPRWGDAVTSEDAVQASLAVPSMKRPVGALPHAAQRKRATLASRPSMRLRLKFSIKLRMISAPTLRRSVHQGFTKELYEAPMSDLKQKYDASTVAVMRQALNEVIADRRFLVRKSVTPLEVAEQILQQAASGVRDLNRLKSSAFEKLGTAA
jgi:hypothetical protein